MYSQFKFSSTCSFFSFAVLIGILFCGCSKNGKTEQISSVKSLAHYSTIEIPDLYVQVATETFEVSAIELIPSPYAVRIIYGDEQALRVYLNNKGEPSGRVSGSLNGYDFDKNDFVVKTALEPNTQLPYTYTLSATVNDRSITLVVSPIEEGWGKTVFKVQDGVAYFNGVIGYSTWNDLLALNKAHPDVGHIIFQEVPGSEADPINFKIGFALREAGYTTEARSDSYIASGGVDLFLAGNQRVLPERWSDQFLYGFFVHGWCCTNSGAEPSDLPHDAIEHHPYLVYSKAMLGDQLGEEFYFYTLNAAPSNAIHRMTDEEIERYGIGTD